MMSFVLGLMTGETAPPSPPPLPSPARRAGHVAVVLGDQVLVWGGYTESFLVQHDVNGQMWTESYLPKEHVWIYHTDIKRWFCQKTTGEFPWGISGASAVRINRTVYVLGGHGPPPPEAPWARTPFWVYALDTTCWVWTCLSDVEGLSGHGGPSTLNPSPRDKFTAWEHEERLYAFGGYGYSITQYIHDSGMFIEDASTNPVHVRGWNNQLLIFDVSSRRWTNPQCLGDVPSPRAAHATTKVGNVVYLFGGRSDNERLNDLYVLNLLNLTWIRIVTLGECPTPRSWHSFTHAGCGQIFVYGGYSQLSPNPQDGSPLEDAWVLDVAETRWRRMSWFKAGPCLWHSAVGTSGGDVVLFGGCTSNILAEERQTHSNNVNIFRISPKPLQSMSLDCVFNHRGALLSQWTVLPKFLRNILTDRLTRLQRLDLGV